jgi:hypothetical protein
LSNLEKASLCHLGGTFEYNEAKCESAFDGFVADVSIKDSCRVLLIEVVVSNDLDDNKIAKIKCSGLECIRIDLSDVDREVSIERLRTLVTEDFKNRMWVHDLQELSPSPTPFFIQKDQGEVTKQENEEKQTKETESYIDLFEVFLWALLVYLVMKKLFGAVTNSGMGYPRSGYSNPKKTRR